MTRYTPSDGGTLADYRVAVGASVVPLDVHSGLAADFRGRIHAATSSNIHAIRVVAQRHSVTRTRQLISRGGPDFAKLSLVERGSAIIVQDGRECVLRRGDMAIYDTNRPYSMICDEDIAMSIIMLPLARLGLPPDLVRMATATRLIGDRTTASIIRPLISSLGRSSEHGEPLGARMVRGAIEIVAGLVESHLPSRNAHDLMRMRIGAYIDEHLTDPELSPSRIAAAHFISLRQLHFLFEDGGTSISRIIRDRRLERCYESLRDDSNAHLSISVIAFANGFTDAAHFSRVFRTHFGFTPSATRALPPQR